MKSVPEARPFMLSVIALSSVLTVTSVLGGCSAIPKTPGFTIAPGRYSEAIAATREVLRDYRFQIDRVDAVEGVITTQPKGSSGLFTPWDGEQTSFNQELEDMANHQERRVRVTFASAEAPQDAANPSSESRSMTARVEVVIDRIERPGWRPVPKAVRHSTVTNDPELADRRMWPTYSVPVRQDPVLSREIAGKIDALLQKKRD